MADVLVIKTRDWELSVWTASLEPKQRKLGNMLQKRQLDVSPSRLSVKAEYLESVAVNGGNSPISLCASKDNSCKYTSHYSFPEPLFFENQFYQFEWIFFCNVTDAHIQHSLQTVADSFHFTSREQSARLTGTLNTRNDIGWLPLQMHYCTQSGWQKAHVSLEVLPVKLAMHHDLKVMYQDIEREYPMWLFSLVRQTQQNVGNAREREYVPLFWLQKMQELKKDLLSGLKVIAASPHNRLLEKTKAVKADKLKGRVSAKLAEKVNNDIQQGKWHCRYKVNTKHLSVNTPENKFIKYAIQNMSQRLHALHLQLSSLVTKSDVGLNGAFLDEFSEYQQSLQRFLKQGFMRDVQGYEQSASTSLVLQQRAGYSKVYRAWLQLTVLLDVLGDASKISMKSIDKVYEVWCFLKLKNILSNALGFELTPPENQLKQSKAGFEVTFNRSEFRDYCFTRSDGVKLRLQLTPSFTQSTTHLTPICTYLNTQEPDLLLEVTYESGEQFIWLFDAKYRVDAKNAKIDLVPKDAINELHRYRDALIHVNQQHQYGNIDYAVKTRPVFGAFALYPGFFDQVSCDNPYQKAIDEVNIGAFALLPTKASDISDVWLKTFLADIIGHPLCEAKRADVQVSSTVVKNLIQDSARIPMHNMKTVAFSELTLTASLGVTQERTGDYIQHFLSGSACWYHIPVNVFKRKFEKLIIEEIRFLAVAVADVQSQSRCISYLWPIKSVRCKPRSTLSVEQAGKINESDELYWLFELDKAIAFEQNIQIPADYSFTQTLKLTTMDKLNSVNDLSLVSEVYEGVIHR